MSSKRKRLVAQQGLANNEKRSKTATSAVDVIDLTSIDEAPPVPNPIAQIAQPVYNSPQIAQPGYYYPPQGRPTVSSMARSPSSSQVSYAAAPATQLPNASLTQGYAQMPPSATPQPSSPPPSTSTPNSSLKASKPKPKTKRRAKGEQKEPELCPEQTALVDLILSGSNVFYTGSAGSGKSTVLRAFVSRLRGMGKTVKIVAPTGRAAVDIGGQTIFTFAGITPDSLKIPLNDLKKKGYGKVLRKRILDTDVLVIDEISMVENHLLERVSEIMKTAKGKTNAFGGVQVVFLGDFYQLPPVKPFQFCITCGRPTITVAPNHLYKCPQHGEYRDEDKWAFRSKAWEDAKFHCVNLNSIHRQKDKTFITILEKCRTSQPLSDKDKKILLEHPCNVDNAVRLFATRDEVRRVNEAEFAKLTTERREFKCLDGIRLQEHHSYLKWKAIREFDNSLAGLKEHRFERCLELKERMLVILLVNLDIDAGLINGSQGVIIGWQPHDDSLLPIAFDDKRARESNPHRPILGGDYQNTKLDCIKQFIAMLPEGKKAWPIVKFDNGEKRAIIAECSVSELGDEAPYSYQCRTQIPLLPAWAMSIHKSQGMTLNKVIVNLARNFEEGQTYVALSRARSLHGLKVEALGRDSTGANPEVREFLQEKFGPMSLEG